jgi:hypothetical protein
MHSAQYELYQQNFGYPEKHVMYELQKIVDDALPLKANTFHKCVSCMHAKCKQRAHNHYHTNANT